MKTFEEMMKNLKSNMPTLDQVPLSEIYDHLEEVAKAARDNHFHEEANLQPIPINFMLMTRNEQHQAIASYVNRKFNKLGIQEKLELVSIIRTAIRTLIG